MTFNLNFDDVFEGAKNIPDGDYEILINQCAENVTPNGAEYIQFDLIVRNDVAQDYQNKYIFHKVWKEKKTGKYNMKTFNTIGKACQLQNGKTYKDFQDLLEDFVHKTARVTVRNEESEYNGKTYTNSNVYWNQTNFTGKLNHQFKKSDDNKTFNELMTGNIEISDDELPF